MDDKVREVKEHKVRCVLPHVQILQGMPYVVHWGSYGPQEQTEVWNQLTPPRNFS